MNVRAGVWAVVVVGTCALSLQRAFTWPIGHDEALTWKWYVSQPWSVGVTHFDANHHVLFTWLAKVAASLCGDDTWCLRLPSMLAVIVYTTVCARLAARSTGSLAFGLGVFASMTLGPRTFEYALAARGYGGALAAFAVALLVLRPGSRGIGPGIALGTCLAFNLAFGWAVIGIGLGAWTAGVVDGRGLLRMALTAAAGVVLVCGAPLMHASASSFYFGAAGFGPLADSLFFDGLRYGDSRWLLWLASGGAPFERFDFVRTTLRVAIAAVFAVIVVRAMVRVRCGRDGDVARVPGLALVIGVVCAAIAHVAFGLPLPRERTALWLVVLAPLAWAELARGSGFACRAARFAGVALALVLVSRTACSTSFSEWWADRDSVAAIEAIRDDAAARRRTGTVFVGCDWQLEPSLRHAARTPRPSFRLDVARVVTSETNPTDANVRIDEYVVLFLDRAYAYAARSDVAVVRQFEGTVVLRVRTR